MYKVLFDVFSATSKGRLIIEVPKTSSAKVIMPDDYKNSKVEAVSLIDQKRVDLEINDGAFTVNSGKYKIIARL